jgi:hypothetical protein
VPPQGEAMRVADRRPAPTVAQRKIVTVASRLDGCTLER